MGRIVLTVLVVLVLLTGALAVSVQQGLVDLTILERLQPSTEVTDRAEIDKLVLGFVGAPYSDDYNMLRIPGWIDSRTDRKILRVTLEIQLSEKGAKKRERITHELRDIAPGTRRTFDINAGTIPPGRTATIEIKKVVLAR